MKRTIAYLLTFLFIISVLSAVSFAEEVPGDDAETPAQAASALIQGSTLMLSPQVPNPMNVGDIITFTISSAGFTDFAGLSVSRLSVVMSDADRACFESSFSKTESAVHLYLKAKAARPAGSVSVSVTDGTNTSAVCTFTTSITVPVPAPVSQPEVSSQPESSSQSSSQPESSSQVESSSQASSQSSSQPESSSQSSSQPESSSEASSQQPRGPVMAAAPAPAATTGDEITGINPSGSKWSHNKGISNLNSATTLTDGQEIYFKIPVNNFMTEGDPSNIDDNINNILNAANSTYMAAVEIKDSQNNPYALYFIKEFVALGAGTSREYGIKLTVDVGATNYVTLPAGTTFSFSGITNTDKFKLNAPLNLIPAPTGSARATGIASGSELGGKNTWISKNGSYYSSGIDVLDDVKQGDEFMIHFYPQFFEWNGDTPKTVTLANIRSKIGLRQTATTGSRVFDSVELTSYKGEAVVRIKFKEPLATTKAIDFKTSIYMTVSSKRHEDSMISIEGTFGDEDPEEFYSSDRDDIDISDGTVGIAAESMNRVRVYIGDGVTLNVSHIRKNAKFYGVATVNNLDSRDIAMMDQFPDIHEVYTLHTVGLNGAGTTVDIDTFGGYYQYNSRLNYTSQTSQRLEYVSRYYGYYIYDANLNYLGQDSRRLEYSNKYYLAVKMLDIEADDDGDDEPPDLDEPGDYIEPTFPPNRNDNPSTGR